MYTPLWCKSNFSFLEGASHPDELVEEAHRLGLRDLALTDRDGVYGIVRAHETARDLGVHLIVGAEVSIDDGSAIVLLAADRGGDANLWTLLTPGPLRSKESGGPVAWSEVCVHAPGLMALWGGDRSLLTRGEPVHTLSLARDERMHTVLRARDEHAHTGSHARDEQARAGSRARGEHARGVEA